jgi:hypothetical protein
MSTLTIKITKFEAQVEDQKLRKAQECQLKEGKTTMLTKDTKNDKVKQNGKEELGELKTKTERARKTQNQKLPPESNSP